MELKELLEKKSFEDVHLIPDGIDDDAPVTIVSLNKNTLTEAGRRAWADVLIANVVSICTGPWGNQIICAGVSPRRLRAFSEMLAGYCGISQYTKWVSESEEESYENQH